MGLLFTATVTTKYEPLTIRTGPSLSNDEMDDKIPIGSLISIYDVVYGEGSWVWAEVRWKEQTGWVCAHQDGVDYWYVTFPPPSVSYDATAAATSNAATNTNDTKNKALIDSLLKNANGDYSYEENDIDGSAVQYQNQRYGTREKDYYYDCT